MDSTSSFDFCHSSHDLTADLKLYHRQSQALSLLVSRSSPVCFSLSLSSLSFDLSSPSVAQPRSATVMITPFFFRFVTWCLKGVLLCIFICGIYYVDFWTWCNGPGFGFGGFILYIFELMENLIVRKFFFFFFNIFFMYLGYVYRIYVWVCDFYILFLVISVFEFVISIFGCVLKGKMRNLKVNYCRFMWNLKSKIIEEI